MLTVKKSIKLYEKSKNNNILLSKEFSENSKLRYLSMTKSFHPYYELHNYQIEVEDNDKVLYEIEAYRVNKTKDVFVKNVSGLSSIQRVLWEEVFEGECPIVI